MVVLEILMVLIGLGAVVYSFRLAEEKRETKNEPDEAVEGQSEALSPDWEEKIAELREEVASIYQEVDDKMSQMSNEKILGMSEYSDQVLDKIEKNHGEVVFLYDMMNAKQEEIQQLVKEIDGMKADIRDEAAGEYLKLKEQEKLLEELREEIELDTLEYQSRKEALQEERQMLERRALEEGDSPVPEEEAREEEGAVPESVSEDREDETADSTKAFEGNSAPEEDDGISVYDAEIARIEEEETRGLLEKEEAAEPSYQPLSRQERPVNHNDEIIALYKKGRSILDISKMLALGQGEVKFVIDLYNAR